MSALYDIIKVPDPVLKETAREVAKVDAGIRTQIDTMLATMYENNGIGLAANQVNLLNRVLVMDVDPHSWEYGEETDGVLHIDSAYRSGERDEEPTLNPITMINPEIVWESGQKSVFPEGCLSIPGQIGDVIRPAKVKVRYLDYDGNEKTLDAEGLQSHCVQHEIDHLNGVLFIDHLSSLKRNMILKRMKKLQKEDHSL